MDRKHSYREGERGGGGGGGGGYVFVRAHARVALACLGGWVRT